MDALTWRDDLRLNNLVAPFDIALHNPCRFWIVHPEGAVLRPAAQALAAWLIEQGGGMPHEGARD